jgi:uncharacterized coiled-coil protein SlyX
MTNAELEARVAELEAEVAHLRRVMRVVSATLASEADA